MARIPLTVGLLQSGSPQDMQLLLKAALLRLQDENGEDEALIITEVELNKAKGFALVTTTLDEEKAICLTVKPR